MASQPRPPKPRMAFIRPFTVHVINPLSRLVAGHLPLFGVIRHVGRRSGRQLRAPVNVFRDGDDYVIALTYSSQVDWVRNVVAAGWCELETGGHVVRLTDPDVFVDRQRRLMPFPVRQFLALVNVTEFMRLHPARMPAAGA
ncbi:MAG TPA: nitroreductase family deazaflavin-dependent oxidoreductase [Candidatus Limnocylindria bacterium]|nr:nitroreductase family deazaflavin-dependent oxidoreductase [Candidatus Limnocylindria bacterium]